MILLYIVQLPTYFYEIIVIFVNSFCTEIFIFWLVEYAIYFMHKSFLNKEL